MEQGGPGQPRGRGGAAGWHRRQHTGGAGASILLTLLSLCPALLRSEAACRTAKAKRNAPTPTACATAAVRRRRRGAGSALTPVQPPLELLLLLVLPPPRRKCRPLLARPAAQLRQGAQGRRGGRFGSCCGGAPDLKCSLPGCRAQQPGQHDAAGRAGGGSACGMRGRGCRIAGDSRVIAYLNRAPFNWVWCDGGSQGREGRAGAIPSWVSAACQAPTTSFRPAAHLAISAPPAGSAAGTFSSRSHPASPIHLPSRCQNPSRPPGGSHTQPCRRTRVGLPLRVMLPEAITLAGAQGAQSTAPAPHAGKGGKNRRRGKNESDEKRELIFKEDGQGKSGPFLGALPALERPAPRLGLAAAGAAWWTRCTACGGCTGGWAGRLSRAAGRRVLEWRLSTLEVWGPHRSGNKPSSVVLRWQRPVPGVLCSCRQVLCRLAGGRCKRSLSSAVWAPPPSTVGAPGGKLTRGRPAAAGSPGWRRLTGCCLAATTRAVCHPTAGASPGSPPLPVRHTPHSPSLLLRPCCLPVRRVRAGAAHAGQRPPGGVLHGRRQAVVPHPRQDAEEGGWCGV